MSTTRSHQSDVSESWSQPRSAGPRRDSPLRVSVVRDDTLTSGQRNAAQAAALGTLLRRCGTDLGIPIRASLVVRLTGDAELRRLNAAFLGEDTPTDVLAFPAGEPGRVGDIAISIERAMAQSDDAIVELRLLAVHGLLHCLGHDHSTPAEAAVMTDETRRLLPDQAVPELVA